jgi:high-affinity nickel-transport protein
VALVELVSGTADDTSELRWGRQADWVAVDGRRHGELLATGVRAVVGQVQDGGSALQTTAGLVGTLVSGTFLALIGALNLVPLRGILGLIGGLRRGELYEAELERRLQARGVVNRLCGGLARAIEHPWQMYPLGLLFGLGFDTATEVALLTLAAGSAFAGLPAAAILCLPILFAAGMSLLDTLDGAFMSLAYGWAFTRPARKLYYNLTMTALSVAVALLVGGLELLSVISDRFAFVDLNAVGYLVVGLFALTWAVAVAVWRLGRIEQRWAAPPPR